MQWVLLSWRIPVGWIAPLAGYSIPPFFQRCHPPLLSHGGLIKYFSCSCFIRWLLFILALSSFEQADRKNTLLSFGKLGRIHRLKRTPPNPGYYPLSRLWFFFIAVIFCYAAFIFLLRSKRLFSIRLQRRLHCFQPAYTVPLPRKDNGFTACCHLTLFSPRGNMAAGVLPDHQYTGSFPLFTIMLLTSFLDLSSASYAPFWLVWTSPNRMCTRPFRSNKIQFLWGRLQTSACRISS